MTGISACKSNPVRDGIPTPIHEGAQCFRSTTIPREIWFAFFSSRLGRQDQAPDSDEDSAGEEEQRQYPGRIALPRDDGNQEGHDHVSVGRRVREIYAIEEPPDRQAQRPNLRRRGARASFQSPSPPTNRPRESPHCRRSRKSISCVAMNGSDPMTCLQAIYMQATSESPQAERVSDTLHDLAIRQHDKPA